MADTNVIVSGLRGGNHPPAQILNFWHDGSIDLLVSSATIDELQRVLNYPKVRQLLGFSDQRIQTFLTEFAQEALVVEVDIKVEVVASDPTDNVFLALAEAGQAVYIVTGDKKHLLPLKQHQGIPIVTPAAFVAQYGQ